MAAPTLTARFDFGRLFTDTGKVIVRAWPLLLLGLLVIGAPTVVGTSIVWWHGSGTNAHEQRVWAELTATKAAAEVVGIALLAAYGTAVSLAVLDAGADRNRLAFRALACGFPTALAIGVFINAVRIGSPFAYVAWTATSTR